MPVDQQFQTKAPELPKPAPQDVYQVQLKDVNQEVNSFSGKEQLAWNLVILDEGEWRGRFLKVWTNNSWFVNPKSSLKSAYYALVEATLGGYGTQVDNEFGMSFNPNDIIGKQVRVTLTIVEKNGRQLNKVTSYMPIKQELAPFEGEVPTPEKKK